MSNLETRKTIGLQILRVHDEECGDGSCGCGCTGIPLATVKPEKAGTAGPRVITLDQT